MTRDLTVNVGYFSSDTPLKAVRRLSDCEIKKVEFNGLPLLALSNRLRKELKGIMVGEGIEAVSISAVTDLVPVNLGNLASLNKDERRRGIDHVKRCVELADYFGATRIVCDTGTTCEDFVETEINDAALGESLEEILQFATPQGLKVVLLNVPGRRWIVWDGLPPDRWRVVERHVWPWRAWPDREEIVNNLNQRLSGRVWWAFDTANEVVAHGTHPFHLSEVASFYLENRLEIIYLANHPGPFNKVWHRTLLHQHLYEGHYTRADFQEMLKVLEKERFSGELILQIREKEPGEEALRKSIRLFQRL